MKAVKAGKYDFWSAAEDEIVLRFYPRNGRKATVEKLPGRTIKSLIHRARFLAVKVDKDIAKQLRAKAAPLNHSTAWTESEDNVLRHLYPRGGSSACLQRLGKRSRDAIMQRARRIGLVAESSSFGRMVSCGREGEVPEVNTNERDGVELLDIISGRWVADRAVPRLNSIAGTIYDLANQFTVEESHV